MRTISGLLVMVVMVGSTSLWAANGDMGIASEPLTDGSEAYPWLIEDLADFDEFADSVNAATYWASGVYTRLACDPNLADRTYTTAVIAPDTNNTNEFWQFDGPPFSGVFDGDGHVISNLTIDTAGVDNDYLGLFGSIYRHNGEVEYLGMENINITGSDRSDLVGGLCGENSGTITNCYATGSVNGGNNAYYLGGLCGFNEVGTITNCYATGTVTGGLHLGGLCGGTWGEISNCFWDREASNVSDGIGSLETTIEITLYDRTTTEMHQQSTFTDWDFINVWNIGENQTYPYIRTYWASDINKDRVVNVIDLSIIGEQWMGE